MDHTVLPANYIMPAFTSSPAAQHHPLWLVLILPQRRLASLIETNALSLRQTATCQTYLFYLRWVCCTATPCSNQHTVATACIISHCAV